MTHNKGKIGFTCAYTPLPLIHAAGFTPYRIMPTGEWPDRAGQLLHDNLCPHVKRILDRAFDSDLPDLSGMVFVNSCDAMRRLADAWEIVRPDDTVIRLDLPATKDKRSISFFAGELEMVWDALEGSKVGLDSIISSIGLYNKAARILQELEGLCRTKTLSRAKLQEFYNRVSTGPVEDFLEFAGKEKPESEVIPDGVPVYLFGNVLPDPGTFSFIESCGAHITGDDLCTGARMIRKIDIDHDDPNSLFLQIAGQIINKPPCARTFSADEPIEIAKDIITGARESDARAVICHTLKFCDPYLVRLPLVRKALQDAGLPMLLLEGDCTLRSIGQHRTRIEAFIEMLR